MANNFFKELLGRYINGKASHQEASNIEQWYTDLNEKDRSEYKISEQELLEVRNRLVQKLPAESQRKNFIIRHPYFAAAAMLLIIFSIWKLVTVNTSQQITSQEEAKIVPGANKATLMLASGKIIDLSSVEQGDIGREENTLFRKSNAGEVEIESKGLTNNISRSLNRIAIPRGGEWKLMLSDGTKVWMNAASSLKFPSTFSGKFREVFLEGEAYFEVSKNATHPFIVHSDNQVLEVLGTHFNINAYKEEGSTLTTLVEGSVRLNNKTLLKPGEQATLEPSGIRVAQADVEQAIAWKDGDFFFNGQKLSSIMHQISRWYDVDVEFESKELENLTFSGSISRSATIIELQRRISLTHEVTLEVKGRKILVKNYQKL